MPRFRSLVPLLFAFAAFLVAAPAGAQLVVPDAPVGGSSVDDCISLCIVEPGGGGCDSADNVGGTITVLETSQPFAISSLVRGPAPSGSSNACLAGTAVPVALPVALAPGQALFFDVTFSPTVPGVHQGNIHVEGTRGGNPLAADIPVVGEATGGGDPLAPCVDGPQTLCLQDDRFKVQVDWATTQGTSGDGNVVPFQTDDSGLFWFFSEQNWEVVVKVLDACVVNDRFWFFAGGLTNVETVIIVTDTEFGVVRTYTNPQGTPFQPIQDTDAFSTCP
jgi:hypothetical protein